jgi:hypothetical protein
LLSEKKTIDLIWRVKLKIIVVIVVVVVVIIIVNIIYIIIHTFEKTILLLLKKNHKFDLKGKIKNYMSLG